VGRLLSGIGALSESSGSVKKSRPRDSFGFVGPRNGLFGRWVAWDREAAWGKDGLTLAGFRITPATACNKTKGVRNK
jgi:hypothetical protein